MSEAELEAAGLLEGIDDPIERSDRVELAEELLREGFAIEQLKARSPSAATGSALP